MPDNKKRNFTWRRSISFKLFLAFSVPIFAVSLFIFLYFPSQLRKETLNAISNRSQSMSQSLAFSLSPALFFQDTKTAEESIESSVKNADISWIIIHDAAGKVFAGMHSDRADSNGYSLPGSANIVSSNGLFYMTRTDILQEENKIGVLYVGYSLTGMNLQIKSSKTLITLIAAGIFIAGIFFSIAVSTLMTRNVGKVVRVMEEVGDGKMDQRVAIQTKDEIGYLAETFNQMVDKLGASTREIVLREQQYRHLVESMTEGLVEFNLESEILLANSRFCQMFGFTQSEIIGSSITHVLGLTEVQARFFRRELSKPGEARQLEAELKQKTGESIWVLVSISPGTGKFRNHHNAIFTDITELKSTESNLRFKNRELDTFVYKASHDLKAPLSSMKGLLGLAKAECHEENTRMYLDLLDRTSEKMDAVLLGLLEVTWMKQGSFHLAPVNLEFLVNEIIDSISHVSGYSEIKLTRNIPAGFEFNTDIKLITSILQNLIQNAFKYHRDSGPDRFVNISIRNHGEKIEISIKDNGPGIALKDQEKIFDMFFRATNRATGSGLGLYIVKNAAEKLKGSVIVQSVPGVGSEFNVTLPVLTGDLEETEE